MKLSDRYIQTGDPAVRKKIMEKMRNERFAKDWGKPLNGNKKPLINILSDNAWRGETCFLIGGGPSLRGFDFERLRGRGRIIAINKAFMDAPFADMMFSMDHRFYKWLRIGIRRNMDDAKEQFANFAGIKCWVDIDNAHYDDIYFVVGKRGAEMAVSIADGIPPGNNSGYAAIQLAMCLGCDPIYLLGYDMSHDAGVSHYHGGYPIAQREITVVRFRHKFESVAQRILKRTNVYNLNPDSALRCFPFANIDDVLK